MNPNPFIVDVPSTNPPTIADLRPADLRYTVAVDSGDLMFEGQLIGESTSRRDDHIHPYSPSGFAPPGVRCFACRWMEAKIFIVSKIVTVDTAGTHHHTPSGRYLVYTVGGSIIPSEITYRRAVFTRGGYEVLELLTIRKQGAEPYMSAVSARALSQAAQCDHGIRDAYVNRAVV